MNEGSWAAEGGVVCLDVAEDGRKQDFVAGGVMNDECGLRREAQGGGRLGM